MPRDVRVVLRQSVEKLGLVGEVVAVAPGFARNYLLPRGLALTVTPDNLRRIAAEKERIRQEELKRMNTVRALGELLATTSVTIEAKAEGGHLFGSVTTQMIVDAFRDQKGIDVAPKSIRLENPLKEIGFYEVPVHLHQDVQVITKVWVVEARA